jgi:NAD/NADP transhydrogenase beta subunit
MPSNVIDHERRDEIIAVVVLQPALLLDKTMMVFGDAKQVVEDIVKSIE